MLTSTEAEQVKKISEQTGSIAALLYGNPMGPMSFGENGTLAEDLFGFLLFAYSWEQSMREPHNYSVCRKIGLTNLKFSKSFRRPFIAELSLKKLKNDIFKARSVLYLWKF